MKKYGLLVILLTCLLTLMSCGIHRYVQTNPDLIDESWLQEVRQSSDTRQWLAKADWWFLTGEANQIEKSIQSMPASETLSITSIAARPFTDIHVAGDFQVQLVGCQTQNSVFVVGSNPQTRQVSVEVRDHTLYVRQMSNQVDLKNVIVRIGVVNLQGLTHYGNGMVLGRYINSPRLVINSYGNGSILLQGKMNISQLNQFGSCIITIMGAETPNVDINVSGNGSVNISGRVGVRNIIHNGNGCIRIVGADSNSLCIYACADGLTSISGRVKLKKVYAGNSSRVYINCVQTDDLIVEETGRARIGLAGTASVMTMSLSGASRFEGGSLRVRSAYARTRDASHANMLVNYELFTEAKNQSSIYYAGSPSLAPQYTSQDSVILKVD